MSNHAVAMCGNRLRGRAAFTLIEVLVVVAIIALLVAILLPSLKAARDQARRTSCGSNLHQVGVALTSYVNDFRGQLPAMYRTTTAFTTYYMRSGNVNGGAVNLGLLANRRYAMEPLIYYCPGQDTYRSASLLYDGPDNPWISEARFSALPVAQRSGIRLRSSFPARLIEVGDSGQVGGAPRYEPLPAGKLGGWLHRKYYNKVVYSDFTGVRDWKGGGIEEGFVSAPHDYKGVNRLFGDTSVRWARIAVLERIRPISDVAPTPVEMLLYYRELDR